MSTAYDYAKDINFVANFNAAMRAGLTDSLATSQVATPPPIIAEIEQKSFKEFGCSIHDFCNKLVK